MTIGLLSYIRYYLEYLKESSTSTLELRCRVSTRVDSNLHHIEHSTTASGLLSKIICYPYLNMHCMSKSMHVFTLRAIDR